MQNVKNYFTKNKIFYFDLTFFFFFSYRCTVLLEIPKNFHHPYYLTVRIHFFRSRRMRNNFHMMFFIESNCIVEFFFFFFFNNPALVASCWKNRSRLICPTIRIDLSSCSSVHLVIRGGDRVQKAEEQCKKKNLHTRVINKNIIESSLIKCRVIKMLRVCVCTDT